MAVFDSINARIRMRILNKPGVKNLTWYSLEKYDDSSVSDKTIIAGMKRRFEASTYADEAQVIQFYDNRTGNFLDQYKL